MASWLFLDNFFSCHLESHGLRGRNSALCCFLCFLCCVFHNLLALCLPMCLLVLTQLRILPTPISCSRPFCFPSLSPRRDPLGFCFPRFLFPVVSVFRAFCLPLFPRHTLPWDKCNCYVAGIFSLESQCWDSRETKLTVSLETSHLVFNVEYPKLQINVYRGNFFSHGWVQLWHKHSSRLLTQ